MGDQIDLTFDDSLTLIRRIACDSMWALSDTPRKRFIGKMQVGSLNANETEYYIDVIRDLISVMAIIPKEHITYGEIYEFDFKRKRIHPCIWGKTRVKYKEFNIHFDRLAKIWHKEIEDQNELNRKTILEKLLGGKNG